MNWMFTRPGTAVRFEKDEPYCHIFPVRRGELEAFAPQVASALRRSGAAERARGLDERAASVQRATCSRRIRQAREEGWQRSYFRGRGENTPNTRWLKDFETK